MTTKQNGILAPDGATYVTITDGSGNLTPVGSGGGAVEITDGSNGNVAVKPASTAPIATDPAFVVTVSPNSPGLVTLGQTTMSNSVPVTLATDQPNGGQYTYKNITTSTTTTVKSGAGTLHTIVINSLGTVASTIAVYDNTAASGTLIATLNSLTVGQGAYIYDCSFSTGLTIVTTGTVAPNVTVTYK